MSVNLVDPWLYVRQALLRQLRSNLVLKDVLPGEWSEGVAPQGTEFPRGIYQLQYLPFEYDWSGFVAIVGVTTMVFAKDQGDAASIDQLVFSTLQDTLLSVAGQTTLTCRRVSSISLVEAAPDGTDTVWQKGAIYAVLAPQSNPANRSLTVPLTSTIG